MFLQTTDFTENVFRILNKENYILWSKWNGKIKYILEKNRNFTLPVISKEYQLKVRQRLKCNP